MISKRTESITISFREMTELAKFLTTQSAHTLGLLLFLIQLYVMVSLLK